MKKAIKLLSFFIAFCIAVSSLSATSIAESTLLGDVDGGGTIGSEDSLALRKYIVGNISISDIVYSNADVDKSGDINIRDMLYLRKYLVNDITDFNETAVDSNLLSKINGLSVTPENLGIPSILRYPDNSSYYYAH